jgi:hypothetical protein
MWRCGALVPWVGLSVFAFAQAHPCNEVKARQAEEAVDGLSSWDRVHKWYKTYRQCDDGVMGEGFSEAVPRNMVDRWRTLPQLAELARNDIGFQRFVLKHENRTLNDNDLKKIRANSAGDCPAGLHRRCRDLKEQAEAR